MHLGSNDGVGEEGNGDDETKRLVMSLRGCLLLIMIWVLSLSVDEEESTGLTEMAFIFEGETFSLLSFRGFGPRSAIKVEIERERKKEGERDGTEEEPKMCI